MLPMLVGTTHDWTGNYMVGFTMLICVALLGTLIISFLPKKGEYA
jgi:cyanate permease